MNQLIRTTERLRTLANDCENSEPGHADLFRWCADAAVILDIPAEWSTTPVAVSRDERVDLLARLAVIVGEDG